MDEEEEEEDKRDAAAASSHEDPATRKWREKQKRLETESEWQSCGAVRLTEKSAVVGERMKSIWQRYGVCKCVAVRLWGPQGLI